MYYFFVALFGGLGAGFRFIINSLIETELFPYSTLIVNLVGCFLLAIILRYISEWFDFSNAFINGLGTGFVGSFTTFSAFSNESLSLIRNGSYITSVIYIFLSMVLGFLSAWLGLYLSDKMIEKKELSRDGI